jgi:hypothetical protein
VASAKRQVGHPPNDWEDLRRATGDGLGLVDIHAPNGGFLTETAPSGGPSSYHGLWPWLVIRLGKGWELGKPVPYWGRLLATFYVHLLREGQIERGDLPAPVGFPAVFVKALVRVHGLKRLIFESLAPSPGFIVAGRGGVSSWFPRGRYFGRRETCRVQSGR